MQHAGPVEFLGACRFLGAEWSRTANRPASQIGFPFLFLLLLMLMQLKEFLAEGASGNRVKGFYKRKEKDRGEVGIGLRRWEKRTWCLKENSADADDGGDNGDDDDDGDDDIRRPVANEFDCVSSGRSGKNDNSSSLPAKLPVELQLRKARRDEMK
ncbi:hypothetical protein M0802_000690 [Mischocyttarus mexicanus]|nr:hypothetical protein M0802_000690 [Mischocyttarus mexicanus]